MISTISRIIIQISVNNWIRTERSCSISNMGRNFLLAPISDRLWVPFSLLFNGNRVLFQCQIKKLTTYRKLVSRLRMQGPLHRHSQTSSWQSTYAQRQLYILLPSCIFVVCSRVPATFVACRADVFLRNELKYTHSNGTNWIGIVFLEMLTGIHQIL
jgi:hypothetical protein